MSALRDQLAEYVSHKRVRAGEIVQYGVEGDGATLFVDVRRADNLLERVRVTDELYHRGGHTPQVGDRLVVYGDGADEYLSISPKKAFEEGYRLAVADGVRLRPTIAELEALLQTDADVEILPNGEVRAHPAVHDIGWAVRQLQRGEKLARPTWLGWYVELVAGIFYLCDGKARQPRAFSDADLLATDWVITP